MPNVKSLDECSCSAAASCGGFTHDKRVINEPVGMLETERLDERLERSWLLLATQVIQEESRIGRTQSSITCSNEPSVT